MIVPAIHKTLAQVADVLQTQADTELTVEHEAITAWARDHLRKEFLAADLGMTGANFVAADTGTIVLVTNEGNGDLCTIVPRVQIAMVPVEKVIARFSDLATLLPLLTMSATGQRISNYVTMINGPRRAGEIDGPEVLHVVFLDHGRLRLRAPRTRTCSPASAAARASTCARCSGRSPVTRTTRCTAGRWARSSLPCCPRTVRGSRAPGGVDAVWRVHRGVPGRDPAGRPPRAAARRPAPSRVRSIRFRWPTAPPPPRGGSPSGRGLRVERHRDTARVAGRAPQSPTDRARAVGAAVVDARRLRGLDVRWHEWPRGHGAGAGPRRSSPGSGRGPRPATHRCPRRSRSASRWAARENGGEQW